MTEDNAGRHVAAEWTRARSLREAAGKELAAGICERAAATLYFAAVPPAGRSWRLAGSSPGPIAASARSSACTS